MWPSFDSKVSFICYAHLSHFCISLWQWKSYVTAFMTTNQNFHLITLEAKVFSHQSVFGLQKGIFVFIPDKIVLNEHKNQKMQNYVILFVNF